MIFAIDPGPTISGIVKMNGGLIEQSEHGNETLLEKLFNLREAIDLIACEWVESYGMGVGKEVFDTVFWCGRFYQASRPIEFMKIPRRHIKLNLCHHVRAGDPDIRRALIERFGDKGTKKNPGPTYGFNNHTWAALAVAATAQDILDGRYQID